METHHENRTGIAGQLERGILASEQIHQFVMDDLDDLLAGMDALNDFLAEGLFLDAINELLDHLEIDIRVQQGHPDLAEAVGDVVLGDFSKTAKVTKRVLKLATET